MSTTTEAAPGPLLKELGRYRERLLPGAVELLASVWQGLDRWPPPLLAEEISRRLEGPLGKKYTSPDWSAPEGPRNHLREALQRHSGELADGERTAEFLTSAWGLSMAGMKPDKVAGEVAKRLAQREHRDHLRIRPELPAGERQIREALGKYSGRLNPSANLDDVARQWSKEIGPGPAHATARAVADRLALPVHAARLTSDGLPIPLNQGDAAFRPPPVDPKRRSSGF